MNKAVAFFSAAVMLLSTACIMCSADEPLKTVRKGDANGDGNIDVTDISCTAAHLKGIRSLDAEFADKADTNSDSKIDVTDIALIAAHIKGIKPLPEPAPEHSSTLVAYFSRTGNTEKIANYIVELTDADVYVIEAAQPYTDADIKYQDDDCRANKEQSDKSIRPKIADPLKSVDEYDTVYLGYPIWWGEEPRIIDTFLESYDLSDKTVIPFCTSGSSGIGASEKNIAALVPIGTQPEGRRFAANADKDEVKAWVDMMKKTDEKSEPKLMLSVNGKELTATLADTQAAKELADMLADAPCEVKLDEYGGFEKVGELPRTLTRSDVSTSAKAGDIMLYQGDKMSIFYGSNSWSYTALGHIDDVSADELEALLGKGDITIKLSYK